MEDERDDERYEDDPVVEKMELYSREVKLKQARRHTLAKKRVCHPLGQKEKVFDMMPELKHQRE